MSRARPWPLVGAAALLLLAATASWWIWFRAGDPVSYRLDGPLLITLDVRGREVWRHPFASEPVQQWNAGPYPRPAFLDVDGDGRNELLFPFKYSQLAERSDILYCFAPRGGIRWQFCTTRAITTGKKTFTPVFGVNYFALVPASGKKQPRVLVGSNQQPEYPMQVALLDSSGKLLREHWHSGHISHPLVTDFDGDGRPEIYLSGIANGYKTAVLVALDPENFGGASVENDPQYQIQGMQPPRELARVLFPRSSLNLALETYNEGTTLALSGRLLTVVVRESMGSTPAAEIYYEFEPVLKLARVGVGDSNYSQYKRLYQQGALKSELTQAEIDSYRNIRFLTPWRK
ncbi:MAG: hypothetical protein HZB13_06725 [Acidobacteria bacterium]|nr:hypothetical protein [Acidobacteriota bacterium]